MKIKREKMYVILITYSCNSLICSLSVNFSFSTAVITSNNLSNSACNLFAFSLDFAASFSSFSFSFCNSPHRFSKATSLF